MTEHNNASPHKGQGKDKDLSGLDNSFEQTKLSPELIKADTGKLIHQGDDASIEVTGEKLLQMGITEIPCLIEPIFQQVGLACLAGGSDMGKSTLARQLAIAIVTGEPDFIGFKINAKHLSVIYVSTEDLEREIGCLLHRQSKKYQPEQLRNLRFILSAKIEIGNLRMELDKVLSNKPADLVIIDAFADTLNGDLKDTQKIRAHLQPYQDLAQNYQCLIVFLHHTSKRTENFEPNKNNLLSGQGLEAKMRLVIELRADLMNPAHRHLCIVKGNYLPARMKRESHVLQFNEETLTFINTDDRVPFELLAKNSTSDNGKAKYKRAKELKEQGYTHERIAKDIGYGSKGSVSKLYQRAKDEGWDNDVSDTVSNGNEGNFMFPVSSP